VLKNDRDLLLSFHGYFYTIKQGDALTSLLFNFVL
jgi:hypothetical protein